MIVTKELLQESFKLLKNDPHYYVNHKEGIEELYKEINYLKEQLKALDGFAVSLDNMRRNAIAKNMNDKNNTYCNN